LRSSSATACGYRHRQRRRSSRCTCFFGIGINGQPDIDAGEAVIAAQYVASGRTETEAGNEVAALNACFGTYEVPPENRLPAKPDFRNALVPTH